MSTPESHLQATEEIGPLSRESPSPSPQPFSANNTGSSAALDQVHQRESPGSSDHSPSASYNSNNASSRSSNKHISPPTLQLTASTPPSVSPSGQNQPLQDTPLQSSHQDQSFFQPHERAHALADSTGTRPLTPQGSQPSSPLSASSVSQGGSSGSAYLPPHMRAEGTFLPSLSPTSPGFPSDIRRSISIHQPPAKEGQNSDGHAGNGPNGEKSVPAAVSTRGSVSDGRENGEKRTLWMGELESWMDETYLRQMCSSLGWDIVSIKLIRQATVAPGVLAQGGNNYCFLTFPTSHLASRILQSLTAVPPNAPALMPNSNRPFKLNWASSSTTSTNPGAINPAQATDLPLEKEFSIFVGDLAPEVSEADLVRLFLNPPAKSAAEGGAQRKSYLSTRSAKIMLDPKGGGSRGYGFVRFAEEADQLRALSEMQGVYCLSRPMRLSHATAKNRPGLNLGGSQGGSSLGESSRGGTPAPPLAGNDPSGHSSVALHQQLLQKISSPRGSIAEGKTERPTSRPQESQQQPADQQPIPPQRRLSPSTIEYLTQLAAANGGTLPFGPGMSLPAFPTPPSTDRDSFASTASGLSASQALVQERAERSDSIISVPKSVRTQPANVPALNIPSQMDYLSFAPGPNSVGLSPGSTGLSPGSSGSGPGSASFSAASNMNALLGNTLETGNTASSQQSDLPPPSPFSPTGQDSMYDHQQPQQGMSSGGSESTSTVFVGGLSSLISEETLKTFFAPFGEITYVKIPPGKGCGFVQFVRKADAERAIDRMQGFPIGGGRIRLSWGRSQYKAAQAAAQATQLGMGLGALTGINGLTPAQAAQLGLALQGLGGLGGGAAAGNANLLRQLAGAGNQGFNMRANQNPLNNLGALGALGGLGAFGGAGINDGGLGGLNLGALAGLNPQSLQSLLALNRGLGNGLGGLGGLGAMGPDVGGLNPALIAQLAAQQGLAGFGGQGNNFGNQNAAAQYLQQMNGGDFTRRQDGFDDRHQSTDSNFSSFRGNGGSKDLGPSPTASFRVPGSSFSHSRDSVTSGTSPFDPNYRPTIPPLQTAASFSDGSSQFFGNFSPPATAPGMINADYLQQQQQQQQAPSRARAASASARGAGLRDAVPEMEDLSLRERTGSAQFVAPGSGRNLRFASYGGAALLRNPHLSAGSRLDEANRFDGA